MKTIYILILLLVLPISNAYGIEIFFVTEHGGFFEFNLHDIKARKDITMTPYKEFSGVSGLLVSSSGTVSSLSQYNSVGSGTVTIIPDWSFGKIYGLPDLTPLEGKLKFEPIPHMSLRDYKTNMSFDSSIIESVGIISGDIKNTTESNHIKIEGAGRALIELKDYTSNRYLVNMVCIGCQTNTPAVIGVMTSGDKYGTNKIFNSQSSSDCNVKGKIIKGCGSYGIRLGDDRWLWDIDPRKSIHQGSIFTHQQVLTPKILTLDTTKCPNATQKNILIEQLDESYFNVISTHNNVECKMETFTYEIWDGIIQLSKWQVLYPGMNVFDATISGTPVIVLNMGGELKFQINHVSTSVTSDIVFDDTFDVKPGNVLRGNDIAVLYDGFSHLGAYTESTIDTIKNKMTNIRENVVGNTTLMKVGHQSQTNLFDVFQDRVEGECKRGYVYCLAVFKRDNLPSISSPRGVVYDQRNGIEMNRNSQVENRNNVFGTSWPGIPVDANSLEVIQTYAVLPIPDLKHIEQLYIAVNYIGGSGCDRYIDDTSLVETWKTTAHNNDWLRLKYLEGDHSNTKLDIPLLVGYSLLCFKTQNENTFRSINLDNIYGGGNYVFDFGGRSIVVSTVQTVVSRDPFTTSNEIILDNTAIINSGYRTIDVHMNLDAQAGLKGEFGVPCTGVTSIRGQNTEAHIDIEVEIGGIIYNTTTNSLDKTVLKTTTFSKTDAEWFDKKETINGKCVYNGLAYFRLSDEVRYTFSKKFISNENVYVTITIRDVGLTGAQQPLQGGHGATSETQYIKVDISRLQVSVK